MKHLFARLAALGALAACTALIVGAAGGQAQTLDTSQATVTGFIAPPDGSYTPGQNLDFYLHYSEPVEVHGGLALIVNFKNNDRVALYAGGSGTDTLQFSYTVASNDMTDGIDVGRSTHGFSPEGTLSGGPVTDLDGDDASLSFGNPGPFPGIKIDAAAPAVTSVDVPAPGTYKIGDPLPFVVHFDRTVWTQDGFSPTLTLNVGGRNVEAYQNGGIGTSDVTFRYTAWQGDSDSDGIEVVALNSTSGMLVSGAGTPVDPTLNDVGSTANVLVDAVAPTVDSVDYPAAGFFTEGEPLDLVVHFNKKVYVDTDAGTPAIDLYISFRNQTATYVSGSGSPDLTFRYTVQPGDDNSVGVSLGGLIWSNGSTIRDLVGNDADTTLHDIGDGTDVVIDTDTPHVDAVYPPSSHTFKTGNYIYYTVAFSEPVVVTGNPMVGLTVGSRSVSAAYQFGSGGRYLSFRYTVQAGDQDADGIQTGALSPNGGTITDPAGHSANLDLTGLVPSTAGVLVDTTPAQTPTQTTTPAPAPVPAPQDTTAPTKPTKPAVKIKNGQLQISFGGSSDDSQVAGYKLYSGGTEIAAIDGTSFKLPLSIIPKPGKKVLELRALDAAGNQSDPIVLTLTRYAAPKTTPKVIPAWAWKLAVWQQAAKATRGARPHTPNTLPKWYAKWHAWHKAPVKVTVS